MTTASGSRHSLASVKETSRGVTPANPVFKTMRYRSTTLDLNRATIESEEIRSDRQISDFRLGLRSGSGNVVGELSASTYDEWLAGALQGTWSVDGNGGVLKAGIVRQSFTLLRNFEDVDVENAFVGCEVNTLQLAVTPGAMVLATFGFMADDMSVLAEDNPIRALDWTAATTTGTLTGLTGGLYEGAGAGLLAPCTELNINLDNGLQNMEVIGTEHVYDRSTGRSRCTGTATFFFESAALLNKFVNETSSAIRFQIRDDAGTSGYDILLPRIKYTGAPLPVNNEGPVNLAMAFQALRDPVTGTNIQITRVLPA